MGRAKEISLKSHSRQGGKPIYAAGTITAEPL